MTTVLLNGAPVRVNNVFCIGRNYAAHIAELGNAVPEEPLIFLKPNSSVLADGGTVVLPPFSREVHYETELVLLAGADADCLKPEQAWDIVAGVGVGLDLTARDVQAAAKNQGLPWTKAKGFKTAACVSAFVPPARLPDLNRIVFSLHHNGTPAQHGDSRLMLNPVPQLLAHLAQTYGLRRGDLVFTGTPAGVGALAAGDELALDLENGLLKAGFTVRAA